MSPDPTPAPGAQPIPAGKGLELVVLGCDGSYAGPGGASSGYLVRSERSAVWLDTGPGTLGRLQLHVPLAELTGIVVTHEHPDHCGELPVVRNALRYLLGVEGMPVITTAGTRRLVDRIGGGAAPTFAWDVVTSGEERRLGDLRLRFARTDHPVETMAVRLDHDGGSIAYTSDTGGRFHAAALDPDGTGVDLLVVEATMPPELEDRTQHLSARQAAGAAVACGARQVLMTHVAPGDDAERRRRELVAALAELGHEVPVVAAAAVQTRA